MTKLFTPNVLDIIDMSHQMYCIYMCVNAFISVYIRVYKYPYGLVGRSYNISEGPGDLGVPEKFTFRWNHAYLVQNCAKNAIQTRKFWEKCTADCFF